MSKSNESLRKVAYLVGLFMVVVYIAIGLCLCLTNMFIDLIPRNRALYGSIVLAYAAFRLYMALRIRKTRTGNEENQ